MDDMVGDNDLHSSSVNRSRKRFNNSNSSSMTLQPLQQFTKSNQSESWNRGDVEYEEEEYVHCIVSLSQQLHGDGTVGSIEDVWRRSGSKRSKIQEKQEPSTATTNTNIDDANATRKEVETLRKELEEAKSTILRWQNVNNKVM